MNTVANSEPRIVAIEVTEDTITAQLADGRTISVPLAWSWRLSDATPEQRNNFKIIGTGDGVHWSDIDEDISARGMLYGVPARPPKRMATRR
jgi:hypothetical protein